MSRRLRIHSPAIHYFDMVRRCQSIREAARRLNVASSAVNRQILKLESEIGSPLFERLPAGLRLTAAGGLQVRTDRLACGCWSPDQPDRIAPLADAEGWWSSGDRAVIAEQGLQLSGRIDSAVQSGGETVFPEQLEQRLMEAVRRQRLPLDAVLLLGVDDGEWGARLVALIRPQVGCSEVNLLAALQMLTADWMAAERPRRWVLCPDLAASDAGKWRRDHWLRWLKHVDAAEA